MLDTYKEMLNRRMMIAGERFHEFAGRSRMSLQYCQRLESEGALGRDLPLSVFEFLRKAYSDRVPYHGSCHVPLMLLTAMHLQHRKGGSIPPVVLLALVGHDAGHNGSGPDSPEALSSALTVDWLRGEQEWLTQAGVLTTGRFGRKADVQSVVPLIHATQFPYHGPAQTEAVAWLRWFDTLRPAAGASAECLNEYFDLGKGMTRFRAFLLDSLGLNDELTPVGTDPRETLLGWLERGQCGFFFEACVLPDLQHGGYYPDFARRDLEAVQANKQSLVTLLGHEDGRRRLLELYDFFRTDCTLIEFLTACDKLGI